MMFGNCNQMQGGLENAFETKRMEATKIDLLHMHMAFEDIAKRTMETCFISFKGATYYKL